MSNRCGYDSAKREGGNREKCFGTAERRKKKKRGGGESEFSSAFMKKRKNAFFFHVLGEKKRKDSLQTPPGKRYLAWMSPGRGRGRKGRRKLLYNDRGKKKVRSRRRAREGKRKEEGRAITKHPIMIKGTKKERKRINPWKPRGGGEEEGNEINDVPRRGGRSPLSAYTGGGEKRGGRERGRSCIPL